MSGGAFGYMGRLADMHELLEKVGWLPELADRLVELGYEDAAGETRALHQRLLREPPAFRALVAVWGAVDYHGSSDYGPERVAAAVEQWRQAYKDSREGRRLQTMLEHTTWALEEEGCPKDMIRRVANRMVYGHPDGSDAVARPSGETDA